MISSRIIKELPFLVDIFIKGNLVVHKEFNLVLLVCGHGKNDNTFKGQVVYTDSGAYNVGEYVDCWYKHLFIQFEDTIELSYKKGKYESLFEMGNLIISHDFGTIICVSKRGLEKGCFHGVTVNNLKAVYKKRFWDRGVYNDDWGDDEFKQFTGKIVLKPIKIQL